MLNKFLLGIIIISSAYRPTERVENRRVVTEFWLNLWVTDPTSWWENFFVSITATEYADLGPNAQPAAVDAAERLNRRRLSVAYNFNDARLIDKFVN